MNIRAYLLLQTSKNKASSIIDELKKQPGVINVDLLDGSPDLIITVDGFSRQELAHFIMQSLELFSCVTEDIRVLITRENPVPGLTEARA